MAGEVGDKTPDFTLPSDSWENKVSLESAGREGPVVLFFYPGDWSSVCTDQRGHLQREIEHFQERGTKVMGVSVDYLVAPGGAAERGIEFPLLSDFQREVIEEYGVKHEVCFRERAYFVIDKEGIVRAIGIEHSPGDQPEVEAVIEDLEKAL